MEEDLPSNSSSIPLFWKAKKKAGFAILVSDKTDFKPSKTQRDKEGYYIMIKGSMQQEELTGPGITVAQTCNPSALGGRGGWIMRLRDQDHPGQHGETPSLLKIQKISWAWWRVPVVPAAREAEAGELPTLDV